MARLTGRDRPGTKRIELGPRDVCFLAQSGLTEMSASCPLSGAKRTCCAHSEDFRF